MPEHRTRLGQLTNPSALPSTTSPATPRLPDRAAKPGGKNTNDSPTNGYRRINSCLANESHAACGE